MEVNCDSVLFRLPKYMFLNFCSDWISTIDFCKLDSSVTNRNFRFIYEAYATSGMLLLSDDGNGVTLTKKCFGWLIERNFLIKTLTAPSNVLPLKKELRNKTTKDIFKRLKSICFVYKHQIVRPNGNKGILLSGRQETLIESCVMLENLDISKSGNMLSTKFYDAVAKYCPLLKVFTAGKGTECNIQDIRMTISVPLKALAKGCKLLEVFTTESSLPLDNAHVTLAENCKHLKVLRFGTYHRQINDDNMLITLADNCPDLREFFINGSFTEPALRKFAMSCKLLTKLGISTYDLLCDAVLGIIGCHCKHLAHLDICNCFMHTVSIGGVYQLLTNCTTLTHISLPILQHTDVLSLFSTTQIGKMVEVNMSIKISTDDEHFSIVYDKIKEFESVINSFNTTVQVGYW